MSSEITSTLESSANVKQGHWGAPIALFIGSALLYSLNLGRFPHPDELYHVLAAREMLETGEPRIADGLYERVLFFTWLLAQLFGILGESLAVARLPSVLAMAGVVMLMFIWLRHNVGSTAAYIGSCLFAISPFAVDIAMFARFYGLQTLAFFSGTILLFAAVESANNRRRIVYTLLAVPALLSAIYFQTTTLIGLAGVGIWLVVRISIPWLQSDKINRKRKTLTILGLFTIVMLIIASALLLGLAQQLWAMYSSAPLFNQSKANKFWFYIQWYLLLYPTLWPAIAMIALMAITHFTKPALFAGIVFVVCLAFSSFAASKGLRYIVYGQPYLFMLIGMGLAVVAKPVTQWLRELRDKFAAKLPLSETVARKTATAITAFAVLTIIVSNPALTRTITLVGNITLPFERASVDWAAARSEVEPWFNKVDIIVTMAELETLYYFDRYDLLLSASRLGEIPNGVDFDRDHRTDKPVIGTFKAMTRVLDCYPSGILLTNTRRWKDSDLIAPSIVNLLISRTQPLELPKKSQVLAFTWGLDEGTPKPDYCEGLPQFRAPSES